MSTRPRSRPRRTLACIVPPYLLRRLAERDAAEGYAQGPSGAARTLQLDAGLRERRLATPLARVRDVEGGARAGGTPRPRREVLDCAGTEDLATATAVRGEGGAATGDAAVDEAYDGLGATWRLYAEVYGRDSIDGAGLPLHGYVHYGRDYDNAFWDGEQMVFGDGDGRLFNRFTIAVDVIGHELTHGVTQVEAGLEYRDQSGALNESLSDVFGSLVKQYARRQTAAEADWLVGDELLRVDGALRSMAAPGTAYDDPVLGRDPQPATMAGYVSTDEDDGGVHVNSGIPNRAFHLAATALGGFAWEGAGRVWYRALRDPRLGTDATFAQFAGATLRAARGFGTGEDEEASGTASGLAARLAAGLAPGLASGLEAGEVVQAVEQAWRRVGVEPAT